MGGGSLVVDGTSVADGPTWRSILKRVEGRRITGLWYGVEDGYVRLELDDRSVLLVAASWEEGCHVVVDPAVRATRKGRPTKEPWLNRSQRQAPNATRTLGALPSKLRRRVTVPDRPRDFPRTVGLALQNVDILSGKLPRLAAFTRCYHTCAGATNES